MTIQDPEVHSNQLPLTPVEETIIQAFNVTDAALAEIQANYMPLTIQGIDDKEGYKKVREARAYVRNKRGEVERKRQDLKADALKYGRAVDAEAKRITGILEEVEAHLETQQKAIDTEKERIKQEEIKKQQEKLQARVNALQQWGASVFLGDVMKATDEQFEVMLSDAKSAWEIAEKEKSEKEEADRVAREAQEKADAEKRAEENKKLEAERIRLEGERKKQEEKEAELKAEQARIDEEKRQIEAKKQAELAEAARLEAEKKEQERLEALKPDKEKLHKLANELHMIQYPEMSTPEGLEIVKEAEKKVGAIYSWLFNI